MPFFLLMLYRMYSFTKIHLKLLHLLFHLLRSLWGCSPSMWHLGTPGGLPCEHELWLCSSPTGLLMRMVKSPRLGAGQAFSILKGGHQALPSACQLLISC